MSKYVIEDTTLSSIADAVRKKTGGTELIKVSELPTAIASISGGGETTNMTLYKEAVSVKASTASVDMSLPFTDCNKITTIMCKFSGQSHYWIFSKRDLNSNDWTTAYVTKATNSNYVYPITVDTTDYHVDVVESNSGTCQVRMRYGDSSGTTYAGNSTYVSILYLAEKGTA